MTFRRANLDQQVRFFIWEDRYRTQRRLSLISQTVEYALRAVAHLANVAPHTQTTDEIAAVTRVPRAYLAKVMRYLVHNGLVVSQRGIGGGMTLAKPASELTIFEVANAVEPLQRIRSCPLGLAEHGSHLCPLHRRLDEALETVESAFKQTTLDEILAESRHSAPLCAVPKRRKKKARK